VGNITDFLNIAYYPFICGACQHDKTRIRIIPQRVIDILRFYRCGEPKLAADRRQNIDRPYTAKLGCVINRLVAISTEDHSIAATDDGTHSGKYSAGASRLPKNI
jgi:hypothetical protein